MNSRNALLIAIIVLASGAPQVAQASTAVVESQPTRTIYLLVDRWHAGIVFKRSEIPEGVLPERRDFPDAEYLEFGWGEWDFYQTVDFNFWQALKALFVPSRSVLHVVGFSGGVVGYAPYREVLEFRLDQKSFGRLVAYIDGSFARRGPGAVAPLGPGLYGDSRFYPAQGQFHLFNTCNTWAAGALQAAGYPMSSPIIADALLSQARPFSISHEVQPADP
ncbi:MAG: DUF2459 domain-containing protein [Gammaproteobacteria bacterium]